MKKAYSEREFGMLHLVDNDTHEVIISVQCGVGLNGAEALKTYANENNIKLVKKPGKI